MQEGSFALLPNLKDLVSVDYIQPCGRARTLDVSAAKGVWNGPYVEGHCVDQDENR